MSLSAKKNAILAGAFITVMSSVWGLGYAAAWYRLGQAETQLAKGFAALAAETLESSRLQLVDTRRGCQALVDAYAGARRTDRLEWATQACSEAGFAVLARVAQAQAQAPASGETTRRPASGGSETSPVLSPATAPREF
jgi:hypothetical protein